MVCRSKMHIELVYRLKISYTYSEIYKNLCGEYLPHKADMCGLFSGGIIYVEHDMACCGYCSCQYGV